METYKTNYDTRLILPSHSIIWMLKAVMFIHYNHFEILNIILIVKQKAERCRGNNYFCAIAVEQSKLQRNVMRGKSFMNCMTLHLKQFSLRGSLTNVCSYKEPFWPGNATALKEIMYTEWIRLLRFMKHTLISFTVLQIVYESRPPQFN